MHADSLLRSVCVFVFDLTSAWPLWTDEAERPSLVDVCTSVHRTAEAEAARSRKAKTLYAYVKSVSFVDFLRTYKRMQGVRVAEMDRRIAQLKARLAVCLSSPRYVCPYWLLLVYVCLCVCVWIVDRLACGPSVSRVRVSM